MPIFVNEAHKRRWLKSLRKTWAKKKANGNGHAKRDVLVDMPTLGKQSNGNGHAATHQGAGANGSPFAATLNVLRVQRVRAEDRVTQIDRAIQALEAVKQ